MNNIYSYEAMSFISPSRSNKYSGREFTGQESQLFLSRNLSQTSLSMASGYSQSNVFLTFENGHFIGEAMSRFYKFLARLKQGFKTKNKQFKLDYLA